MNNLKAVIFDMDGVIIDSEPYYYKIQQKLFNELGFTVSKLEYSKFVGAGLHFMWKELSKKHNLKLPISQLLEINNDLTYNSFKNKDDLVAIEGFLDFFNYLKRNNFKTAVASSTPKKTIEIILTKLNILDSFDVIISAEEVTNGKPAPDIFLKAADLLTCDPTECVVIEDSQNGVRAAITAGMKCIGLVNPSSGDQDLSFADIRINKFSDLSLKELV
ncbi:MAG: HAD family phosphatase [Candidatus Cloacimonetes bacterium]|nr:HAD family phosphatase [Candidatus Cloacimonadota bacterium]